VDTPAAGDDRHSDRLRLLRYLEILKQRRAFVMNHSYVGKR